MTLKEWAERERLRGMSLGRGERWLVHVNVPDSLKPTYPYLEVILHPSHCWDCADWYVYRKVSGAIMYYQRLGDSTTVREIDESDLESLTINDIKED